MISRILKSLSVRRENNTARLTKYKTEIIGVSAEIAIADAYGVAIGEGYRRRGDEDIIRAAAETVREVFEKHGIPTPVLHTAEGGDPVDFIIADGEKLSVKTNQKKLGKIAPQNVGQVTSKTYFRHFAEYYESIPSGYEERCLLFKTEILKHVDVFIRIYWDNLFDCDYLIYFYDFLNKNNSVVAPRYIVFPKTDAPNFAHENFTFTKNLINWNESNTVKYCGISIGEFQVHSRRDNFKFRFNMNGICQLILKGLL